jgi:hypothetical protein
MSPEFKHSDPPPLSVGPQKVTVNYDGSWKAVIECPKDKAGNCGDGDFELRSHGAENIRRRMSLLRKIGLG